MPDENDRTFKWTCPNCNREFEESDFGMLEARRNNHRLICKQEPTSIIIENGMGKQVVRSSHPRIPNYMNQPKRKRTAGVRNSDKPKRTDNSRKRKR